MSNNSPVELNRNVEKRQLDKGIGDTFVSVVDVSDEIEIRWSSATLCRVAKRPDAAIVTVRQSRLVKAVELSINSNSSSQSCAESLACSGPNNSVTAATNDANSRSANCIR